MYVCICIYVYAYACASVYVRVCVDLYSMRSIYIYTGIYISNQSTQPQLGLYVVYSYPLLLTTNFTTYYSLDLHASNFDNLGTTLQTRKKQTAN